MLAIAERPIAAVWLNRRATAHGQLAKMVHAWAGDFRDWAAIQRWEREIEAALRSGNVTANTGAPVMGTPPAASGC